MNKKPNHGMQRMRANCPGRLELERQRRLAPTADAHRWHTSAT